MFVLDLATRGKPWSLWTCKDLHVSLSERTMEYLGYHGEYTIAQAPPAHTGSSLGLCRLSCGPREVWVLCLVLVGLCDWGYAKILTKTRVLARTGSCVQLVQEGWARPAAWSSWDKATAPVNNVKWHKVLLGFEIVMEAWTAFPSLFVSTEDETEVLLSVILPSFEGLCVSGSFLITQGEGKVGGQLQIAKQKVVKQ